MIMRFIIAQKTGDIEIFYKETNYSTIENNYYLIIYKNKALTNVRMDSDITTIEDIKTFISNNENSKTVNIINGKIETNSEIIAERGISQIERYNINYYQTIEINEGEKSREYTKASLQDFQIYSTYQEKFKENSIKDKMSNLIEMMEPYEKSHYVLIPISVILLLLLVTYLIISIGYTKGKEGIDINDFDKIPIEIILFIVFITILASIAGFAFGINTINTQQFELIISTIVTTYLINYYVIAITINTIIKRIKAKKFGDTSWTIRFFRWILSLIKIVKNQMKDVLNTLSYSTNVTAKVILYCLAILIISFFIFIIFESNGWIIEIGFLGYIVYMIIRDLKCLDKIEKKLKEMYEGSNNTKLNEKEFSKMFTNSVRYINDISNGFENAIQEGMKSERLKTELITNVSHDIKTPLTSIINYVDLLKRENINNEKANEYIDILDKKSQRLKKLTEDLIEASKVSSGNVKLNIENINICELIKQTTGEFEDKFKEKGLEIITNIPNEKIIISADNRYMYRVIENLFSNISKYALENSRVYIDIEDINGKVKIRIKNISKEKLNISAEELMQRFVRGDKSRTTEGSGLGISISKSLTELQKGEFKMEIDGDLFKIELLFSKNN